jgi:ribosomal protein S18 acetylase RimI-like enzyme
LKLSGAAALLPISATFDFTLYLSKNPNMFDTAIAQPADVPVLVDIINQSYRGEASKVGWTTEADLIEGDIRTDEANLRELMANERAVFIKCTSPEGLIQGCVYLEHKERGLYLGMLSVRPEAQGSGTGKRLLQAAAERAKSLKCPVVFMQVVSERPELMDWYRRHGYELTGERKPFDGDHRFGKPRRPLEFWFMEKKIMG